MRMLSRAYVKTLAFSFFSKEDHTYARACVHCTYEKRHRNFTERFAKHENEAS